jgi:hypothetical protein
MFEIRYRLNQPKNTAGQGSRFEPSDEIKLSPSELLELAPPFRDQVAKPSPGWPDLVDAAGTSLRIAIVDTVLVRAKLFINTSKSGRPSFAPPEFRVER